MKSRHNQNGGLRDLGLTYPGTTQFKKKVDKRRKAAKAAKKARRVTLKRKK